MRNKKKEEDNNFFPFNTSFSDISDRKIEYEFTEKYEDIFSRKVLSYFFKELETKQLNYFNLMFLNFDWVNFLNDLFKEDGFRLIDANKREYLIGKPKKKNPIILELLDSSMHYKLLLLPELYLGEGYMDGKIKIHNGTITEFLEITLKNYVSLVFFVFLFIFLYFKNLFFIFLYFSLFFLVFLLHVF